MYQEQAYLLLKQKMILDYSPLINPRGRSRGIASSVAYKQKRHTSPDLKNYTGKKTLDSIHDVYNKTASSDSNDCGLFAMPFAASLRYKDVASLVFCDQLSLSDHYVKCIENNEIRLFPSKSNKGSIKILLN